MSQSKYIKGFTSEFDATVQNVHRHIQQKDFDAGVAYAEERIIKLLEEQAEITGYVEIKLGKLIALIRGENK